jgi:F420-dependent oxidoreductase-like protein
MRLGLNLHMTNWHTGPQPNVGLAQLAEELGYHSVWCEEAYGSDSVSVLGWIGASTSTIRLGSAVWQIPARTPASAGMTAATLDVLSGGRLIVGLGTSGPQVVEGWHGQAFNAPVARTREYLTILRRIFAREEPVSFDGRFYQLPYTGADAMGIGKPLKLIIKPRSRAIPVYIGALGPKNIEMTAELADGWLPIYWSLRAWESTFAEPLERGFAKAGGGKGPGQGFDVAPVVSVVVGDDVSACRLPVKQRIALYIGGMGHAEVNFSNQLMRRFGYADVADEIQQKFLAGDRDGAVQAVPDEMVDDVAICGPRERVAALLERWRATPVTTLISDTDDPAAIRTMAEVVRHAGVAA